MKRTLVAAAGLGLSTALSACGFQPLYGDRGVTGSSVRSEMSEVAIAPISDRAGQMLRNELLDRLTPQGQPASPRYRLVVRYQEDKNPLGIRVDETATRANMNMIAHFVLKDTEAGVPVYNGNTRAQVSYNIVSQDYGTIAAERDARERGVVLLAEAISLRVALYFNRLKTLKRTAKRP